MASAFDEMYDSVQPKSRRSELKTHTDSDYRSKAFIPSELPKDFLRIILDQKQISENHDKQLAQQLQFGYSEAELNNARNARVLNASLGRGRLQIDIVEAKLNKNYGLLISKMDPYVRIRVGQKIYETPADYGSGKTPKWRKTLMCFLPFNVDTISFEIFDEKSFSADELIAFVNYPIPETVFSGEILDEWIPLSGKLGEQKEGHIRIQMIFIPNEIIDNQKNAQNRQIIHQGTPLRQQPQQQQQSPTTSINQPHQVSLPPETGSQITSTRTNLAHNFPVYTEDDLKSVKEMFPTFDEEVVKSLLESNNGNREATIEAILQMN